jgi:hypothetical protein
MEVRAHPSAQIYRLTHINDFAFLILHQVAAGFGGQRIENTLEMIGNFNHSAEDSNTQSLQSPYDASVYFAFFLSSKVEIWRIGHDNQCQTDY